MSYEQNRKDYERNVKIGLGASMVFHLLLLSLLFIKGGETVLEFKEGYSTAKTTDLDLTNIVVEKYDMEPGGGGGGGGGTDPNGGGPDVETLSGIPVPSSHPSNVEFDLKTSIPDSASKNKGLKAGPGYGSGEGPGSGSGSGGGIGSGKGTGIGSGTGDGTALLTFIPKQILEVIPERSDNFKGIIKLSVRIGKEGLVKDHKVLQNTTDNTQCLLKVLEAAYKSKWQSVKLEGKFVEYWTEKTYRFE